MKYLVNWIPLRIRVRSRNNQPHLWLAVRVRHFSQSPDSGALNVGNLQQFRPMASAYDNRHVTRHP